MVPLLVLQALRPRAKNLLGVTIDELFIEPPRCRIGAEGRTPAAGFGLRCFGASMPCFVQPSEYFPAARGYGAIARAVAFVSEPLTVMTGWCDIRQLGDDV